MQFPFLIFSKYIKKTSIFPLMGIGGRVGSRWGSGNGMSGKEVGVWGMR